MPLATHQYLGSATCPPAHHAVEWLTCLPSPMLSMASSSTTMAALRVPRLPTASCSTLGQSQAPIPLPRRLKPRSPSRLSALQPALLPRRQDGLVSPPLLRGRAIKVSSEDSERERDRARAIAPMPLDGFTRGISARTRTSFLVPESCPFLISRTHCQNNPRPHRRRTNILPCLHIKHYSKTIPCFVMVLASFRSTRRQKVATEGSSTRTVRSLYWLLSPSVVSSTFCFVSSSHRLPFRLGSPL